MYMEKSGWLVNGKEEENQQPRRGFYVCS